MRQVTASAYEDLSLQHQTNDLVDELIAEEEGVDEYWASLAECVYTYEPQEVSETDDAANIDHLFV